MEFSFIFYTGLPKIIREDKPRSMNEATRRQISELVRETKAHLGVSETLIKNSYDMTVESNASREMLFFLCDQIKMRLIESRGEIERIKQLTGK